MAGIIAVGIGLGAEKLGRKISEKRLERKEKKAAAQHDLIYGTAESSSSASNAVQNPQPKLSRKQRKMEEAQRERENRDRRSLSAERLSDEEAPPPSYEEVIRETNRRG
ncbi:hypothetical protein IQ07DRAFT_649851 [Pyrenochaeta sp. DS3sAY3a]|nr:hypothetical protein IQ07DRAFT_649851 [Pyrenochaeta sp. DS3sAY3a]